MRSNIVYLVVTTVSITFENGKPYSIPVNQVISRPGTYYPETEKLAIFESRSDAQEWCDEMNSNSSNTGITYRVLEQDIVRKKVTKPRKLFLGPLL